MGSLRRFSQIWELTSGEYVNRLFQALPLAPLAFLLALAPHQLWSQSLGNAGTVEGTLSDPSGAPVPNARVRIINAITSYTQEAMTNSAGRFRLSNIPPNPYHFSASAPGFAEFSQDVTIRGSIPITITPRLSLPGTSTTVNVESAAGHLIEPDVSAHVDVDRNEFAKLP